MKLNDIVQALETLAPLTLQESYDNAGLCTGTLEMEINKVLLSLDITEEVVDEAIKNGCELIVAHHPLIFKPLKKLTGSGYVEKTVIKAIKNDIALYASHTNLDNVWGGVNFKLAEKIGLTDVRILQPSSGNLSKLTVFVPNVNAAQVMQALDQAGAGQIGHYKNCSFRTQGIGTFMPNDQAKPHIGNANQQEEVEETRLEVMFPKHMSHKILASMRAAHPYEEVAYYLSDIENTNQEIGAGAIGLLSKAMEPADFLQHLKKALGLQVIKHTPYAKTIHKVALCGGSGSFLLKKALAAKADAYISADFKYHDFFDAENKLLVADIGHYESERFTHEIFLKELNSHLPNLEVAISQVNTNPTRYYI
jgi:dinuclear metal center YbgI/SA1388 family protein